MSTCRINDQDVPVRVGQTILDHAHSTGAVRIPSSCSGNGTCHECIVAVDEGADALSPRGDSESFLTDPYRLACRARVERDDVPLAVATLKRKPQILVDTEKIPVPLAPAVQRAGDAVVRAGEMIDASSPEILGLAVDVGTTTVAAQIVDLESGEPELTIAFENPQIFGGSNVLHRIDYDNRDSGGELRQVLLGHLNGEIRSLTQRTHIYDVVVTGNATMRDLFFGLPVETLGVKPFRSVTEHGLIGGERESTALTVEPANVGLAANGAGRVYGAPLISCHVGADAAAGVLATRLHERERPSMLVDIGTNTEVVVGNKDRLIAASCPAGPAFEGSGLRCGMPGLEGAIESFRHNGESFDYGVIGDVPPRGICGSGIVDMMAELTRIGAVDLMGRFAGDLTEFIVAPDQNIGIDRQDLSQLAQAKAANSAGQHILLRKFGIGWDDLEHIFFSGGFANYLNVENAQAIGMLPPVDPAKVLKVGNASLQGAVHLLVNAELRTALERLVRTIEHIELEAEPDFFDVYVEGCMLQPMQPGD